MSEVPLFRCTSPAASPHASLTQRDSLLKAALPNPKPSTLNLNPSTLNPNPSTLNPKPSTLNPNPKT